MTKRKPAAPGPEMFARPFTTITNPAALRAALRNAQTFASNDTKRPVLCSVKMIANEETLTIVSTDSHLLLVQELAVGVTPRLDHETGKGTWEAVVHRDGLRLMGAALQGVKETVCDLECKRVQSDADVAAELAALTKADSENADQPPADPPEEGDKPEPDPLEPPVLTNAGELTLKIGDSEVGVALYDSAVFPTWEPLLDYVVADIDGASFMARVLQRLGSIAVPSDDPPKLDLTFTGDQKPVMFTLANVDDDLKLHGAFMPTSTS